RVIQALGRAVLCATVYARGYGPDHVVGPRSTPRRGVAAQRCHHCRASGPSALVLVLFAVAIDATRGPGEGFPAAGSGARAGVRPGHGACRQAATVVARCSERPANDARGCGRGRYVRRMTVLRSLVLFGLAALAEIGGAWLVWQGYREDRGLWCIAAGMLALGAYGFVATFQPDPNFGLILAAYGGAFVAGSLVWAMVLDGFRPDRWDLAGALICLVGVAVIMYAPR